MKLGVIFPATLLFAFVAACSGGATQAPEVSGEKDAARDESPTEPSTADKKDAAPQDDASAPDGSLDAEAPKPEMIGGESGQSCAESCKAKGKSCAPTCTERRSCGSHDGKSPPYAGYACYYYESKGGVRFNQGRSFKSCEEVVDATWDYFGDEYRVGSDIGAPVLCCCQ